MQHQGSRGFQPRHGDDPHTFAHCYTYLCTFILTAFHPPCSISVSSAATSSRWDRGAGGRHVSKRATKLLLCSHRCCCVGFCSY